MSNLEKNRQKALVGGYCTGWVGLGIGRSHATGEQGEDDQKHEQRKGEELSHDD